MKTRFYTSEDQLYDELCRRAELHQIYGSLRKPCDKCGSYNFVAHDFITGACECIDCWTKRRYLEIIDRKEI